MNTKCEILIIVIALSGFTWQITSITLLFMKYEAANELTIEASRYLPVPSITLCAYLPTLVNETALRNLMESRNLPLNLLNIDPSGIRNLSSYLTTGDHFAVTPRADDLWLKFRYRVPNDYSMKRCEGNCSSMFTWSRYMHLYFMCYRYRQRFDHIISLDPRNARHTSDETFSFFRISHSLESPKLHFQIDFDHELLLNVSLIGIHATSATVIPHSVLSHYWSVFQYPFGYSRLERNKYALNTLFVSYKFTRTTNLPPPYASHCHDYSKRTNGRIKSSQECLGRCIQAVTADKLNLMTTSSLISEPTEEGQSEGKLSLEWYEYPLYSSSHARNRTISEMYKKIVENCSYKCIHQDCIDVRYFTELKKGEVREEEGSQRRLTIRMYIPDSTTADSKSIALINLNTYLIYILNSLSFWSGLSIFSLHTVPKKLSHLLERLMSGRSNSSDGNDSNNNATEYSVNRRQYLRAAVNERRVQIRDEERGGGEECNKEAVDVKQIVEQVSSRRVRRVRKRPPFDPQERASLSYYPRI